MILSLQFYLYGLAIVVNTVLLTFSSEAVVRKFSLKIGFLKNFAKLISFFI